jgi:hypothetical protein
LRLRRRGRELLRFVLRQRLRSSAARPVRPLLQELLLRTGVLRACPVLQAASLLQAQVLRAEVLRPVQRLLLPPDPDSRFVGRSA